MTYAPPPWLAVCISVASLLVSGFSYFRDRAVLKATSQFIQPPDESPYVYVRIVNKGRRSIILRMWGGSDGKDWSGNYFGNAKEGLRLAEHEMHDFIINRDGLYNPTPDADIIYADLWVEDTLGRRHKIKNAKANVARLQAS
jgi:hypothetical protein